MNYKGYIGNVEYDDEAHILSGSVINARAVITFQGNSVEEVEREFRASVDDYLEWCAEDGVEPEKPYSGKFNVRFTPALHAQAVIGAKTLGISLNRFVAESVEDKLRLILK